MKIVIFREIRDGERRVAASPSSVRALIDLGYEVLIEQAAGEAAGMTDAAYREAGAVVAADAEALWRDSDVILKVRPPDTAELQLIRENSILICFIAPAQNEALVDALRKRNVTVLAMDQVPRISRAQKLDALSAMANVAGYRSVVEAAHHFGKFLGPQSTAAGRVPPARVLVIGAGVAGLAAVGAARSMGAVVSAFDTRPATRQQIESMGAKFLTVAVKEEGGGAGGYARQMSDAFLEAERELFTAQAKETDIIITTAQIPGKPAPKLLTEDVVKALKPGSVVMDLAAEQGGNCTLTEPGKMVVKHGVMLSGYTDLPSRMAEQSSRFYANNLRHLLFDMTPAKDGNAVIDPQDAVVRGMLITHQGEMLWPPPAAPPSAAAPAKTAAAAPVEAAAPPRQRRLRVILAALLGAAGLLALGQVAPPVFMTQFIVFVLSCFVGWQVIWNVTPALHTSLISVTNAISGIIIIGALLQTASNTATVLALALITVFFAMINIAGGFLVTHRMLKMFRKSE